MKLLPYHAFDLHSPLRLTEAMQALAGHVEPVKGMGWIRDAGAGDRFKGEIDGNAFKLQRIIGYRNSFLPLVTGEATADGRGARVAIRMRLPAFIGVFLAVWCLLPISIAIATIVSGASPASFFALVMILFMYALTTAAFWYEASKQEKVLRAIFRAV